VSIALVAAFVGLLMYSGSHVAFASGLPGRRHAKAAPQRLQPARRRSAAGGALDAASLDALHYLEDTDGTKPDDRS
jgi:hypothetical protein